MCCMAREHVWLGSMIQKKAWQGAGMIKNLRRSLWRDWKPVLGSQLEDKVGGKRKREREATTSHKHSTVYKVLLYLFYMIL